MLSAPILVKNGVILAGDESSAEVIKIQSRFNKASTNVFRLRSLRFWPGSSLAFWCWWLGALDFVWRSLDR